MTALKSIGLVVAGVIVGLLFSVVKDDNLSGVYNNVQQHFQRGLKAGTGLQLEVEADGDVVSTADATFDDVTITDDLTVSGGAFDITTSNSATSSITVGCIDGTATSTATPIKFTLGKEASTATTTFYGGTSKGTVYWEYGSCN